jgi:hypothetical protein
MATRVIGIRADDALIRALDTFARECGISRASATTILLGKGLGLARMQEAEQQTQAAATAKESDDAPDGSNGHTDDSGFEPLEVSPQRGNESPPQVLDAAAEQLIDEIVCACWGLHPIESQLLRDHPAFVLADPPTTRTRFMDIVKEAEHLGHKRNTTSMRAVLLERLRGRPGGGIGPWGMQPR